MHFVLYLLYVAFFSSTPRVELSLLHLAHLSMNLCCKVKHFKMLQNVRKLMIFIKGNQKSLDLQKCPSLTELERGGIATPVTFCYV